MLEANSGHAGLSEIRSYPEDPSCTDSGEPNLDHMHGIFLIATDPGYLHDIQCGHCLSALFKVPDIN